MGVLEPHRGDFCAYETLLSDDEQKEIRLREFLEREVRPVNQLIVGRAITGTGAFV